MPEVDDTDASAVQAKAEDVSINMFDAQALDSKTEDPFIAPLVPKELTKFQKFMPYLVLLAYTAIIITFALLYAFNRGFKMAILGWITAINGGSIYGWMLLGTVLVVFQLVGLPITVAEII